MKVVIAEKPSVAKDIARVLKAKDKRLGYYWGNGYAITWAFGHIIGLSDPESYGQDYKKWALNSLPLLPSPFKTHILKASHSASQFQNIKKLLLHPHCQEVICATDAGREGELIFRLIYEKCRCKKPIKRLWISSQTDQAISEGFASLKPSSQYDNLYHSAKSRAEADWLVGINATRAYTLRFSQQQGVMSVGRVQTPVLKMIVDRTQEHENFKPQTYFEIEACFQHEKGSYKGSYIQKKDIARFFDEEEAKKLLSSLAKEGSVTHVEKKEKKEPPPLLYDLTSVQKEANRLFRFSADNTLKLLQNLYEKHKLLSYPRTSSRYLSSDLKPKIPKLLRALNAFDSLAPHIATLSLEDLPSHKRLFNDAKITDHHAIIPTDKAPSIASLSEEEKKIYFLVLKRFVCAFMKDCHKASTEILSSLEKHVFKTHGTLITFPGWRAIYKQSKESEDLLLPPVKTGDPLSLLEAKVLEKQTKPPPLYNEASLLAAMETAGKTIEEDELRQAMKNCGLGTPATRAQILERLLQVGYVLREKNLLKPTSKGRYLVSCLLSAEMQSPQLTGSWEKKLNDIVAGSYSRKTFMEEIKSFTASLIDQVKNSPVPELPTHYFEDKSLGKCPKCQKGFILQGKFSYYCSRYKDACNFKLPLLFCKKKLSSSCIKQLLNKGQSPLIKGFTSPSGRVFNGQLSLGEDLFLKILTNSNTSAVNKQKAATSEELHCPLCESQLQKKPSQAYACIKCSFALSPRHAGKKLTSIQLGKLIRQRRSGILKGFRSKSGKKFEAELLLDGEGKVKFRLLT